MAVSEYEQGLLNRLREYQLKLGPLMSSFAQGGLDSEEQDELRAINKAVLAIDAELKELHSADDVPASLRSGGFQNVQSVDYGESRSAEEQRHRRFGEYLQAVARAAMPPGEMIGGKPTGQIDRVLLTPESRSTGMEESVPSSGGFAVSQEMAREIYAKAHPVGSLYDRCRKINISAPFNGIKLPTIDESSRADGSRPFRGYWKEEGGSLTAKSAKLGQIQMELNKLTILCYITSELLQDSVALGSWVETGFAEEAKFKLEDSIIRGSGAGQFLGLLNAAATVSCAKKSGQAARTLIWDNLKDMYSQLWAKSRSTMVWLANQSTLPELMSMSQPVGTGGVPVWLPASGASGSPYDTLLGRPLILAESCSTLGTAGDLIAFDPVEYLIIEKTPFQFASSAHISFTTDEWCFRYIARANGQPLWATSLTPYKDASTSKPVSPYVMLATRA